MAAKKETKDTAVSDRLRRDHNRDLIRRMRNGDALTSFDSQSSWFPPRPIIQKDAAAIDRLYSSEPTEASVVASVDVKPNGRTVLRLVR